MILAKRFSSWFDIVLELGKFRISLLVCLSAAAGYVLASGHLDHHFLLPTLAVFILAGGSAALNHYQERDFDRLMKRTSNRPVPSGRVTPLNALAVAVGMIVIGSILLYRSSNITALLLGLVTVFWYNGVYTPLKRKTPLAVIPGALIGALPPAIGWTAAGGSPVHPFLLIISVFFFVWQIPHFWLLLLKFGDEFEKAGYPTLTSRYSNQQIAKFTFSWITITVIISMIIPVFGVNSSLFSYLALFFSAVWLLITSRNLLHFTENVDTLRNTFLNINVYIMLVMSALTIDRIW
jgi:protoheme IX farnesyltransferase